MNAHHPATPLGIDLSRNEVYECGAILLAVLAFPSPNEMQRRLRYHQALCGHALHTLMRSDSWAWSPQRLKPGYLRLSDAEAAAAFKTTERRLRDRLMAAHIAMAFAKEAAGLLPSDPVRRLSLNTEAVRLVETMSRGLKGPSDPHDAERRIWRPSLPVIHIACAVAHLCDEAERLGHDLQPTYFLFEPDLIGRTVGLSEYYAGLLLSSPTLPLDGRKLIRLVLAEGTTTIDAAPTGG